MLRWRIIMATAIITFLVALGWLDFNYNFQRPGMWLFLLVPAVTLMAVNELLSFFEAENLFPCRWVAYCGTLLIVLAAGVPVFWVNYPADCPVGRLGWPTAAFAVGIVVALAREVWRYEKPGESLVRASLALFIMAYVGILLSFMIQIRIRIDNGWGMVALLSLLVVVKFSDIGAFAFGKLFGRHRLMSRVSPGKTIEGALGGIATACFGAWFVFSLVAPAIVEEPFAGSEAHRASWWSSILFGISVAIAGMIGDLAESLLKREAGKKDSSTWLLGLGGVMDLIDSILFAAPVAYMFWVVKIVGP